MSVRVLAPLGCLLAVCGERGAVAVCGGRGLWTALSMIPWCAVCSSTRRASSSEISLGANSAVSAVTAVAARPFALLLRL